MREKTKKNHSFSFQTERMDKTFSLEQNSKRGSLDSKLILLEHKLDLVATFMGINSINPKLKQHQLAKEIDFSSLTLKRYRNDINMLSPKKIPPNSYKKMQKNSNNVFMVSSNQEIGPKRTQMTSKDLEGPQRNLRN